MTCGAIGQGRKRRCNPHRIHTQDGRSLRLADAQAAKQVRQLEANCREFGIELYDFDSPLRGIVHVVGPELGRSQPGMTIVCGDSHTSTHGAFGTLAFGIGSSEVGHVLATQSLLQQKPKTLEIRVEGSLPRGVTAKDLILALIGSIGVDGATYCALEFVGSATAAFDMEERMTLCNMAIECGAKSGIVPPDDTTLEFVNTRAKKPYQAVVSDADA